MQDTTFFNETACKSQNFNHLNVKNIDFIGLKMLHT